MSTDIRVEHMRRSIQLFRVMRNMFTNSVERLVALPHTDRCLHVNLR